MIYDIVLSKYLTEFSLAFSIEYIERVYNVYKKNITPYVFCVVILFTNIFFSVLSKSNDYGRTIRAGDLGLGKAKKKNVRTSECKLPTQNARILSYYF